MHHGPLPKISPLGQPLVWKVALTISITVGLWPSLVASQGFSIPGQNPLTDIEEIELVYAGIQPIPEIIVRGPQPANSFVLSSYLPPDGRLDLIAQVDHLSYRTDVDALLTISDDTLRYGRIIHQSSFSGLVAHDLPGYLALQH